MIITTTTKVFFYWYERKAMLEFEEKNPAYKKIAEDTNGTTYEYNTYYYMERKDDEPKSGN